MPRISSGSITPCASTSLPSSLVAAGTVICWPKMARTASSKPSHAPGTRRPGLAATSGASTGSCARCAPIVSGSAARSNTRRTRAMMVGNAAMLGNRTVTLTRFLSASATLRMPKASPMAMLRR